MPTAMTKGTECDAVAYFTPLHITFLLVTLISASLPFLILAYSSRKWVRSLQKSALSPSGTAQAALWSFIFITLGHLLYYLSQTLGTPRKTNSILLFLSICLILLLTVIWACVCLGRKRLDYALTVMVILQATSSAAFVLACQGPLWIQLVLGVALGWITNCLYINVVLVILNHPQSKMKGKAK